MTIALAVTGVLLAAGGSTRLGQPKQLLSWYGQPLIVHAVRQLWNAGCNSIVVVLGASASDCRQSCHDLLAAETDLYSTIVWLENDDWRSGQASSLRLALQFIAARAEQPSHFLVALGDQPKMLSHHLRALIDATVTGQWKVAATRYVQGGGVPACFRQDCVHELLTLEQDAGAKTWIRRQSAQEVALFDFGDATTDIDTPEDWHNLLSITTRSNLR